MQFLTLPQIKQQLRLDVDDTSEDEHLTLLGDVAEEAVATHLNRTLYIAEVPDEDSTGRVINQPIRMAMLLMVGQLYENREASITGTIISEVPLAYSYLLERYRIIPM